MDFSGQCAQRRELSGLPGQHGDLAMLASRKSVSADSNEQLESNGNSTNFSVGDDVNRRIISGSNDRVELLIEPTLVSHPCFSHSGSGQIFP